MTRRTVLRFVKAAAVAMMMAGLGWSTAGWAIDLQEAKSKGLLGEQPNGYLGLVKADANKEAKGLMDEINSLRKKEYQAIAKRNNTELNIVESLAGKKAIDMTPSGQYIKLPSGDWTKK